MTDSVFSMDGDVAPLAEIVELARRHGARMVVDEAHAIGNLGPGGRGAVAEAGLEGEVDVVVGTLGKALGSYGAYACASSEIVRYLINTARSLIFSTAPVAARGRRRAGRARAARASARTASSGCAPTRASCAGRSPPRASRSPTCEMHIVPLVVGEERAAMRLCQEAIERGVFAQAIRPPTVPAGTSRLRLTAMASHTASELQMAARVLGDAARELGLEPASLTPALAERETAFDDASSASSRTPSCRVRARAVLERRSPVPFDLERDGDERPRPAPALRGVARARSTSSASISRRPRGLAPGRGRGHARAVRHRHRHGRRQDDR